ncbi:MAG: hypothetical protein ACHQ53_00510 [Polyangiales bacterium]
MMAFERRWASHLLAAFAPEDGPGLAPAPGEVDYLGVLRRMMHEATPLARLGLRLAIWIAALAPLWLWGKLATVSKLGSERRAQLLGELLLHRAFAVRELCLLLKLCAAMALLGSGPVRMRSGYDRVQPPSEVESGVRVRKHLPLVAGGESTLRVWPADDSRSAAVELPEREAS